MTDDDATNGELMHATKIGERYKVPRVELPEDEKAIAPSSVPAPELSAGDEVVNTGTELTEITERIINGVEALLPGQEMKWVKTISPMTQGVVWPNETLVVQTVMRKIGQHDEAVAKLCELISLAKVEFREESKILGEFYNWMYEAYGNSGPRELSEAVATVRAMEVGNDESEVNTAEITDENAIRKKGNLKQTSSNDELETEDLLMVSTLRKIVMPLIPGHEIDWVTITRKLTEEMPQEKATLILNAIRPQLEDHPSARRQAQGILVAAAGRENMNPLQEFYKWIEMSYRIPERQRLNKFTSLLKGMSWSWQDNPADQLQAILSQVQLSWEEVAQKTSFSEELKAAVSSKIENGLYLMLNKASITDWYDEITSFWMQLRESVMDYNTQCTEERKNKKTIEETTPALIAEAKLKCFKCRRWGHATKDCMKPRRRGKGSTKRRKNRRLLKRLNDK